MNDHVCQIRIGDGRDEVHERAATSLEEMVPSPWEVVVVDDSDHTLGFAGAIREAWQQARATKCDWIWHAEMDFIYSAPVPIEQMVGVLKRRPYLAQLALKRQPVNEQEIAAGGIVEMWPDEYVQVTDLGDVWTEHRINWTTNPSLYPIAWASQEWPLERGSEMAWTHRLLEDERLRFAYWGPKFAPPTVTHIGERQGVGY